MDSEVEPDGADPGQISVEVVGIESHQQMQQQQQSEEMKRIVADDGSEMVLLTAAKYDEMLNRQQVADWLYDQLHDEQRQRREISEKCRVCSEALVRENNLVMRYRQLLIGNRLQPKPVDDEKDAIHVGAELPETFFEFDRAGGEKELEARGRFPAGSGTESVRRTEDAAPSKTGVHRSVLEPDEAVVVPQPVSTDATAVHGHWKDPARAVNVASATDDSRSHQEKSRRHRQLLDEASDAMNTVPLATSSTMSHDLLQKVLEQNARLKQLLRKIVDTEGMTIREFLVSCSSCFHRKRTWRVITVSLYLLPLFIYLLLLFFKAHYSTKPQAEILKLNNVNGCNDISFGDHSILYCVLCFCCCMVSSKILEIRK